MPQEEPGGKKELEKKGFGKKDQKGVVSADKALKKGISKKEQDSGRENRVSQPNTGGKKKVKRNGGEVRRNG